MECTVEGLCEEAEESALYVVSRVGLLVELNVLCVHLEAEGHDDDKAESEEDEATKERREPPGPGVRGARSPSVLGASCVAGRGCGLPNEHAHKLQRVQLAHRDNVPRLRRGRWP